MKQFLETKWGQRTKVFASLLASVAIYTLAFPPFNFFFLCLVASVPFLLVLRESTGKQAIGRGYLFGVLFYLAQMGWLLPFVNKWTGSIFLAAIPWVVASCIGGLYFLLLGWLIQRCFAGNRLWAIPFAWAGIETVRSFMPMLAFPWGLAAFPLFRFPALVQFSGFGTIVLVSAWVIAINLIVMLMVYRQNNDHKQYGRQTLWITLGVFGLMLSNLPRVMSSQAGQPFRVTLGQVGVDMAFTERNEEPRLLAEATADIVPSAVAAETDLLVLPEGFAGIQSALPPATFLGVEPPVPVIMGGQWKEGDLFYQSALLWDGKQWHHADKTRLVVFGEYVPFRKYLPFLKNFNLGEGDLSPAKEVTTLQTDGAKFGCMICFEGVFSDIPEKHQENGANLLVQMSIDDWYIETPAFEQLWGSTVWRSIESGMPVVRVGALGQSLVTDARGNIVYKAPLRERRADTVEVALPDQPDGFPYRSWFGWVALVLSIVVALMPPKSIETQSS